MTAEKPTLPDPIPLPSGVSEDVHREIMRRIRNRWHEKNSISAMASRGYGITEIAGVLPLFARLPAPAVMSYMEELKSLLKLYCGDSTSAAKISALIYLALKDIDPELAAPWLANVREDEHAFTLRYGEGCDIIGEVIEASERAT